MKILLHASSFAPHQGGVEELSRQLAAGCRSLGHEVSILTMRWPRDLPASELVGGTPVRRIHFRSTDGARMRRAVMWLTVPITLFRTLAHLRRLRPDVVNVQCVSSAAWFVARAAKLLGIPLVVTLQGELTMDATGVYQRSAMTRAALRYSMRHAALVTACSQATLTEAETWADLRLGGRGWVIHNGVSVRDFDDASPLVAERPYVLAVARLVPQKGIDVLVRAYERLRSTGCVEHDLLIAGDGPLRTELERLAVDLDVAGNVVFLGPTDRAGVASLFRGASVFVLPSFHEPFGIVVLEAMAAGAPVVATRVGGVPEFVVDGVNGLLVEPNDADGLASAIAEVLADQELTAMRVAEGRHTANSHDWNSVTLTYLRAFESVVCSGVDP